MGVIITEVVDARSSDFHEVSRNSSHVEKKREGLYFFFKIHIYRVIYKINNSRPATVYYINTSAGVEKCVTEDTVVYKDTATGAPFVRVCHYVPKTIWGKLIVNPFAVRNDTTVFYMPL